MTILFFIVLLLAAIAIYVVVGELPSIRRYLDLTRMAKEHDGARPDLLPNSGGPPYAQGPRRAGEADRGVGGHRRGSPSTATTTHGRSSS